VGRAAHHHDPQRAVPASLPGAVRTYGLKPVYLTNYEMAVSDAFVEFGARRAGTRRGRDRHAPACLELAADLAADQRRLPHQPYLIEYPDHVMEEKIEVLTRLLEERFDEPMVSHRSGRWPSTGATPPC